MIYVVSNQLSLFESTLYKRMTIEESIQVIDSFNVVQFDSETTGRDAHLADILCVQFGNDFQDVRIVVDCTTVNIKLYKEVLEKKYLIMQNGKFDIQFLFKHNIVPLYIYDTMIVEQFLHLGYPQYNSNTGEGLSYSLAAIAKRYLDIDIDKTIRGEIIWRGLDEDVIKYAAYDVVYLEQIMNKQLQICKERNCLIGAKLECDFVPVISYLEWCGIKLDVDKWKAKMLKDETALEERRNLLNHFAIDLGNPKYYKINRQGDLFSGFDTEPKCTINWDSSRQVVALAKELGFNTSVPDKSTGEDKDSVLEKHLRGQKGINDKFLKLYFDFKEASKVCSTYGQSYINAINPKTGRIHTTFWQLGADTGRMSCGSKQPNHELAKLNKVNPKDCKYPQLQNLPADEDTRAAFVCEEGNLMNSCDFSAIESRLGADIYNDKEMLNEFLYGSGDMHSLCAKLVFREELKDIEVKDIAKVRPDLRKKVKSVEFAKQFGGSSFSIAGTLGCSIEEADIFSNAYDDGFKGVSTFAKKALNEVKNKGYILICAITGHKSYWYDWDKWCETQRSFTKEFWEEYRNLKNTLNPKVWDIHPMKQLVKEHFQTLSKWGRKGLNSPTQGTGAVVLKYAMILFFRWIIENNLFETVLLCNLVHDEAVIEYPETMSEVGQILKEKMEESASIFCKKLPIPAQESTGKHWIH